VVGLAYKTAALLSLSALAPIAAHAQAPYSTERAIVQNALSASAVSALGALVHGKNVVRAALRGAMGGALIGASYVCAGRSLDCAWPAKFGVAAGSALMVSGARGDAFFSHVHVPIGPLVVHPTPSGIRTSWNMSEVRTIERLLTGGSIDANASLRAGSFVVLGAHQESYVLGAAYGQSVLLHDAAFARMSLPATERSRVERHELIHVLQHDLWGAFGEALFSQRSVRIPGTSFTFAPRSIGEVGIGNALRLAPYQWRVHEREAKSVTQ
jgi:hypothetical protein